MRRVSAVIIGLLAGWLACRRHERLITKPEPPEVSRVNTTSISSGNSNSENSPIAATISLVVGVLAFFALRPGPPDPHLLYESQAQRMDSPSFALDLGDAEIVDSAAFTTEWAAPRKIVPYTAERSVNDRASTPSNLRGVITAQATFSRSAGAITLTADETTHSLIEICRSIDETTISPDAGKSYSFASSELPSWDYTQNERSRPYSLRVPAVADRAGGPHSLALVECTFRKDALIASDGPLFRLASPSLNILSDPGTEPGDYCIGLLEPPLSSLASSIAYDRSAGALGSGLSNLRTTETAQRFGCIKASAGYGVAGISGGQKTDSSISRTVNLPGFVDASYDPIGAIDLGYRGLLAGVALSAAAAGALGLVQWLERRYSRRRLRNLRVDEASNENPHLTA